MRAGREVGAAHLNQRGETIAVALLETTPEAEARAPPAQA